MLNSKPKVAVVENDSGLLKAVGRLLAASGYEVALFTSAEKYLSRFERTGADYLLLDIALDGMSGLDLQKKLCQEGIAPPIIFITGQGDLPSIGKAIDNGCVAYLHKPFEARSLLNALKAVKNVD
ncbi:MAG: response regulator [Burkholderiales bacterium]|nr:response regulator [Burkholderiales bacterium]